MSTSEHTLSERIGAIAPSRTTEMFELAQTLRRQGREIINLAVGEPVFPTPTPIIEATSRALSEGITRYGPVAGIPILRESLATVFKDFDKDNILITNGAKQALYMLFQVLFQPGDEVILPRPCWVSFTEQVKLAGAEPVLVDTAMGRLDPDRIKAAVNARTRAILLNTPNNPTGAVYDDDVLQQIDRLAAGHGLYLIADEAYHAFTYDGRPHTCLLELAEDKDRVITVRSFSKHYNMTGFRVGYVAAHKELIAALARLQGHLSGNVCSFAQYGALAALEMDQQIVARRRAILEQRRDLTLSQLSGLFPCPRPGGAFYIFADVSAALQRDKTDVDLCMRLLDQAGVALVPGSAFFGPGHVRISFGASEDDLRRGIEKIKGVL